MTWPTHPTPPVTSVSEERALPRASERPVDPEPSAGRSPLLGDDAHERVIARLQELGAAGRGANWTCPRHGGGKRSLRIARSKKHPGAVVLHCLKCDAGRRPGASSLVLETLGWTVRDLFPHDNRDVVRCSHVNSVPNVSVVTGPRPPVDQLEKDHAERRRQPEPVELGPMPGGASDDMRLIAEDMRLLLGLFRSAGETRPMPYACTWAAERMGWGRKAFKRANRAILALSRGGVVWHAATLRPQGAANGTKCYLPPPADLRESEPRAEDVVEDHAVGVEGADARPVQPPTELCDQVAVDRAESAVENVRMVATNDGATSGFRHAPDDNALIGKGPASQPSLDLDHAASVRVVNEPHGEWLDEIYRRFGRRRSMTLALPLLNAIGRAVHQGRGDMGDVEDLIRVWERLERDMQARVDRMHHAANRVRCCCSNGGRDATESGRCSRCYGRLEVER